MAFASVGGQFQMHYGNSAKFLNLHGQLYHRASSLHPNDGTSPKFAQLYIVDSELALRERLQHLNQIQPNQDPWQPTENELTSISQVYY